MRRKPASPSRKFPEAQPPVPVEPVEPTGPIRLLSKKEVLAIVGVSGVTLWSWTKAGTFPAPRVIGPGTGHSRMGWLSTEVEAALLNAPRRYPKGARP
jgi:predicted DNA-binding transcriptional regulator AlpA